MITDFARAGYNVSNPDTFIFEPTNYQMFSTPHALDDSYIGYLYNQTFSETYLSRSKKTIEAVAEVLIKHISQDSKCVGKCNQIADFISHSLNRLSINSIQIHGSLFIKFSNSLKSFDYKIYRPGHTRGHVWLFSPTHQLIDLTFSKQHYTSRESKYIFGHLLVEGNSFRKEYVRSHNETSHRYVMYDPIVKLSKLNLDMNTECTDPTGAMFTLNNRTPNEIFSEIKSKVESGI